MFEAAGLAQPKEIMLSALEDPQLKEELDK
jgi:hypothetical protein